MRKILFRCNGGFGKQIMATAIAKMLREENPDAIIHVQTSYPEAFTNLEFIDRFFPLQNVPYFYEEHKDFEIVDYEPYLSLGFRKGEEHLIESWCKHFNLSAPSHLQGIVKLDEDEEAIGKQWKLQSKIGEKLIAFQPFGGTSYYNPEQANDKIRPRHNRDLKLDVAQGIADSLSELGFTVLQIGLPTEPKLQNCIQLPENIFKQPRLVFSLINQCSHAMGIDSFMQHLWSAMGKTDMMVFWGGTNPASLGYETNLNMTRAKHKPCSTLHCNRPNTFLFDFRGNGSPWRCVLNGRCMAFDVEEVMAEFKEKVLKIPVEEKKMKVENLKPKPKPKKKK